MHALAVAVGAPIFAHGLAASAAAHWELEPLVIVPLAVSAVLYACGLARVWRRAGWGRGLPVWSVISFAAGWTVVIVALMTPVAWLSQILFSIHMTQHMLLMLIAAPLLTLGQPLLVWMWALGDGWREGAAHAVRRPGVVRGWHAVTSPLSVFLIQAAALWLWHIPSWYQAALRNDGIHALEHVCLVLAASLFWWGMVRGRYGRIGYGLAVVYIFLTAVHSSVLGALLTVSEVVWYADYGRTALAWQVDPLADQQLAGLLMWVPAGVVFIVFGLALFAAWLGEAERRVRYGVSDAAARRVLPLLVIVCSCAASSCGSAARAEAEAVTGGRARAGQGAIGKYGCGSCHTIPGIRAATATVGPPLDRLARRHYLGGHLTNTPDNLIKWIQHPQAIDPKNAMPELGVSDQDAKDIAAFLYTLR